MEQADGRRSFCPSHYSTISLNVQHFRNAFGKNWEIIRNIIIMQVMIYRFIRYLCFFFLPETCS